MVRRIGERQVIYRSVRVEGRVRTQYLGSGPLVAIQAEYAALERDEAKERRRQARQRDQDQDKALRAFDHDIETLARAVLTISGYHRHRRGPWRRTMNPTRPAALDRPSREPMSPEVEALRARVAAGDLNLTSAEARKLIRAMPELAKVEFSPPDLVVGTLLERYYPNHLLRETVRVQFGQVKADLEGPDPTAMESLLAERAAVCWLTTYSLERAAENASGQSIGERLLHQRKVDGAHRRFLTSLKTLATVRRLALPDLKVTIDRRSVHVGQPENPPRVIQARSIEVEAAEVDRP